MNSPIHHMWRRLWQRLFTLQGWRPSLNDFFRRRLARRKRRRARAGVRVFRLDEDLLEALRELAVRDGRSQDEVAADLLASGLTRRMEAESYEATWETLSPRQKQVAALLCQGHSNAEIARLLHVSPQTAKSHASHILGKFRLSHREDLRRVLAHWDFTEFSGEEPRRSE